MVQCTLCRKFVHGTCDSEADLITYHQRKEAHPDYEYVCLMCKNLTQPAALLSKRNSIEDSSECVSTPQESPYEDNGEFDSPFPVDAIRNMGLGKGKPYSASKIAKKRLGLGSVGSSGRPKGVGKGLPGKVGFMKRQRLTEFGRKRGAKAKMRGVFGVPGVGLQRPVSDGKNDEEPGVENRLVLCSAKDKFVLTQDICVMCGALGTDQEGCLIACVQCGQCYHPYCVNVKITKVILQKGWRCLDCTVCEGCGQRNDEARLILCDDCDISYHIYCMDPPLDYVPHGNWKCKWCAICQSCGATDPGFNCTWMNSFSECGPCASHVNCPSCSEPYSEGDLIIQCVQCERWLHGTCDAIKTEDDAEKCAEEGYNCLLCRPRDVPPPHLIPSATSIKPPTPTKSPEVKSNNNYYVDGVYLSETGFNLIKSLSLEQHGTRKKRKKIATVQDKEAGIMATIESVVAGGSTDNVLEDSAKLELVDVKDEPQEIYKEGMMWMKDDGPPPDGFTIFTMENGISVLRRKRQRNLQKLGIGGFLVRMRGIRSGQDNDDIDVLPGQSNPSSSDMPMNIPVDGEKPRRKPVRRKPKSKLAETFPPYLQEAFFGKDLLDSTKEIDSSSSDEEKNSREVDKTIHLTQDEIKAVAAVSGKHEVEEPTAKHVQKSVVNKAQLVPKEEEEENTEDLKDVLAIPGDLLDTDLVNTIMNEGDAELNKNAESLDVIATNLPDEADIANPLARASTSKDTKDELSDILGPNFNLESMPNINGKDVEDIFKGVLTDDSQESQESNVFPIQNNNSFNTNTPQTVAQHPVNPPPVRPTALPTVNQSNMNSPLNFPPPSPYQSEYSNSPQFSPAFSEPPSPWVSVNDGTDLDTPPTGVQSTYNQRSSEKMKADEGLGNGATISAVLYANINHPEWKTEFPNWSDRYKQILKKWRTLSPEQKAPYLQQARDNRSALRMKKQQQSQISKDSASTPPATPTNKAPPPAAGPAPVSNNIIPSTQVPPAIVAPVSEDQEKVALQHKSAREAEQERQWKQLQALRQQQAQQQQNVIHEQRVQSIARVQRQISDPTPFPQEQPPQDLSPVASPSPNPRQLLQMGIKSPTFTHPNQTPMRPPPPAQTPLDFPADNDPYAKQPSTPKLPQPTFQTRLPADPYAHQPSTPRPQFQVRPNLQGLNTAAIRRETPELSQQLRDLLQRQQQFKKLDDQLLAGKGQQRVWPPAETSQEVETPVVSNAPTSGDATFRQPLPPSIARPRIPVPVSGMPRQPSPHLGLRMQLDPRIQGLDPRMRLLIQQQRLIQQTNVANQQQQTQQQQQVFAGGAVRFATGIVRPTSVEQYEQLLPRQQPTFQPRAPTEQLQPRLPVAQLTNMQRPPLSQTPAAQNPASSSQESGSNEQEIPDNVTAELEKLEQETGTMAELQGVGDILGGLDDDDELLAEMGPDFNILEYADPEALPGEKTNILDLELEEEPIKSDKARQVKVEMPKAPAGGGGKPTLNPQQIKKEVVAPPVTSVISAGQAVANNIHPPPLAISQAQNAHALTPGVTSHLTPQQIHQQMVHQVQQAAALGKPMPPGSKLQSPDGIIGIVTLNNSVQLQIPQGYHQRLLVSQLQNQKLQMRLGQNVPRMMSVAPVQQGLHPAPVGLNAGPRLGVAAPPPPPPPPYPGPPPPYPGSTTPQQQEQPLLLEDLLEQEKREQEKQNQTGVNNQDTPTTPNVEQESTQLLTDHDFDRITDVLGGPTMGINSNPRQAQVATNQAQPNWPQNQNRPKPTPTPQPTAEIRVQTFNANLLQPPPLPPENIVTEQDKQKQLVYEQWLSHQNNILTQQLKYYDTEVTKLRKMRKSLNSKQRQLRKTGGQLTDIDASELQRIAAEQAILQKHLESSRKLSKQHGLLIQEYRNKRQAKQRPGPGQSPLLMQQNHSPLGPPSSSPIHHSNTSQSPMMSPSASPLAQHSSPMHSPSPMISHSPGPGSVSNILQSPNGMSPIQPSPRIGTPHSQGDSSPGPAPSPSQVCLPPPAPRMTSPQHKRVVTSPVGYSGDLRPGTPQMRFVRTPIDHGLQRRLPSPLMAYQQKPGTPSPLSSPPPQQINITQQLIQKQLQQQNLDGQEANILNSQRAAQLIQQRNFVRQQLAAQQQQQQQQQQGVAQPQPLTPQQHQMMVQQQQQLAKQQQQQIAQMQAQLQAQQRLNQQQNNAPPSPMPPKSPLISQQIMSPHSMPPSPMPPRSPMMNFNNNQQHNNQQPPNSPVARNTGFHPNMNQPPSSPMTHVQYQPPNSPMPRSPMIHSPMGMRRPPSSPAMPDRPTSVDNSHPRTPYSSIDNSNMMDNQGGGNPNNPNNPIPAPPGFGRFGYFKLGLRGGSPMWSYSRGAKRIPTPPGPTKDIEKSNVGETSNPIKPRKESHLSKVSILKRKSPAKTNLQSLAVSKVGSLVSTDYNEFDDSSCTPPVTPPPAALQSTSRVAAIQKTAVGKKISEVQQQQPSESKEAMIVHSPEEKQIRCDDIMDYDDDNNTVISGEVSLSSTAQQNDGDDIAVIETFSQSDLGEAMSSPLESDQIADEYLLFPGNMVVDLSGDGETHYSDKEEAEDEEYRSENMHVVIRSPTTSDDEFIMQNKTKKYNIRRLPGNHLLESADSPEQEEMQTNPSPEGDEETTYEESEIVIIDPSIKSPDEQISTKEDFEELIDEGSRKDKIMKQEVITAKTINEIHKYANVYSFPPKTEATASVSNTSRVASLITSKLGQKFSLITTPVVISRSDASKVNEVSITQNAKATTTTTSKVTNIILHSGVRSNVLSVPKLVTSGSSAITIVSANTSPISSILPSGFTVPVISASAVRQLPNVKVIDKPSSSISLTTHDSCLPKKIFEDDSVSPDSSNCDDDKSKDSSDEKSKTDSPPAEFVNKPPPFVKTDLKVGKKVAPEPPRTPSAAKDESPKSVVEPVVSKNNEIKETSSESKIEISNTEVKQADIGQSTNVKVHNQRVPSPVISKTSPPVIIHNTPELKMTAQVIQESQSGIQITARAETVDGFEGTSGDDTKSVVISIPSPTPSQEQMLDNIALQALENRRRDGNGMSGEFESFEDVLDMIENITGEPPTVLEDNIKDKLLNEVPNKTNIVEEPPKDKKIEVSKPSVVPQLSPLSQPTDLTTNMANASQQLRTLLSLHTTTASSSNNVETVVKSINQKIVSTVSVSPTPVVTSRVIQQASTPSSLGTVIVPNMKPKTAVTSIVSPIRTQPPSVQSTNSLQVTTSGFNFLPARSGGIQLMPEHPKLPRVTTVNTSAPPVSLPPNSMVQKSPVIVTTTTTEPVDTPTRKCSLTEMLQSHPAAVPSTKTSTDTITAASLLGTSMALSRSGFSTSLVQAQPHVVVSPVTSNNLTFQTSSFGIISSSSLATTSGFKPVTSSTNLLHTQLTKVMRHKSLDDNVETLKVDEIKTEPMDMNSPEQMGCKYSSIQTTAVSRSEDSQNALLKKLLQNTACASTQTPPPSNSAAASITVAAPMQFQSSLENQLKASILPPVVKETVSAPQKVPLQRTPIMTRETSFVSSPVIQQPQTPTSTQQLHIDIKKCMPPSRTPSRDDLLSPQTPRSSCSQDSSLQTPPLVVKKELCQPMQQEVKKEFVDETSQHSEVSDQSRSDVPMKEELDSLDPMTDKMMLDKEELKKQKRRMYQQKRRQNQIMNKEAVGQPKKRPRKSSKVDEDYDTYIDGVLAQLRTLPPMVVSEPVLNRNFSILPVFGSDLSKLVANDYDSRFGELKGGYGNGFVFGYSDFYSTQPYGDQEPLPEKPPASTQRGFYDQEFPLIKFDNDDDKRFDMFCREDTPDSIISSSSPECPYTEPPHKFLGLKLISEEDDEEEEDESKMRLSPVVPIIAPIPIRLKPAGPYLKDYTEDKENVGRDVCLKSKFGSTSNTPLKDSGNVTVTLTLTSSAAEDIMGVLRDLANILHIPAPTSYQIVERTSTPPSQKLGLYRTKGKDGKEGAPIDIQSILNGAAKFCKHCDVVILNNMIKKKVSELPFLSKDSELLSDGDELFFCSTTCYMQFALMHRSPSIPEDKAAAIIDHLCQKDKMEFKGKRPFSDSVEHRKSFMDNVEMELHYYKREMEPMDISEMKTHGLFTKPADAIKLRKYDDSQQSTPKVWRGSRYKSWAPGCLQPPTKHKKPTDKETMELLYRLGITVTPPRLPEDFRKCMFCQGVGDGVADGPARLLNFDVDKWVHLNCGLWSDGVYETVNGALMNLENALQQSLTQVCIHCSKLGATIRCFKARCSSVYHLTCAVKDGCVFYKNKTTFCTVHIPKNEKDNELTTLSVSRRVYVNRDENRQVAAVMHHSDTSNLLRVGSLIFLSVGQLLPHQLQNFHNQNYIYPIGYKIIRFYWSMRHLNKRCKYICSIHESCGRPEFKVLIQETLENDVEFKDYSPKAVWQRILEQIAAMRRENQCVQLFPQFVSGEDLFGLTEPAVVRVLESLPGIETLTDYKFKYGRNPLLELPLAINPSGAARTEPRSRNQLHWKRPHTQRTGGSSVRPLFGPTPALTNNNTLGEGTCPYTKQFVHSKSSQYKKMKQEWRNNVYLARSKIQGLGLYAARDIEKHTMVIEYIGEIIRTELAETREKKYEAKNRGIYMFRLDEERVVDATLCGGLARYINHSCNPNCVAETVEVDRDYRIIIFAKRRIQRGEELAYDYKFDIEDDQHKISCMCGAPNCRKWMN